jgi:hypothetical protein
MPKVNPQTGEVLVGEDIAQGLQEGRQRQREGEFAQYLQKQGLAPGAEAPIPEGTGPEFMNFMKAGGLKGYQEEQVAKQQGQALSGIADQISTDNTASSDTRNRAKAYAGAFRSGGVRGPAAIELLKELQQQHMLDQNAAATKGIQEGIIPESLDDYEHGVRSIYLHTDAKGMVMPKSGPAARGAEFNARVGRMQFFTAKQAAGISLTPEEHTKYERDTSIVNTMQRQIQTPDMYQINLGGFPLSLRGAQQPLTPKVVKPGEPVQSGNLVPESKSEGLAPGQTTVKIDPEQKGWQSVMPGAKGYTGPYQAFHAPPRLPQPGEIGTRIAKPPTDAEMKELRDMEFSINSLRNAADRVEGLKLTDRDRQIAAAQLGGPKAAAAIPILGKVIAPMMQATRALSIRPELAELQAHITNTRNRYDTAIGGMKGGGSVQFYAITAADLISDLSNVNAPIHFRGLANDMQATLISKQREMSQRYDTPSVYLRPETPKGNKTPPTAFGTPKTGTAPAKQQPIKGSAGATGAPMNAPTNRPPLSSFQR